MKKNSIKNSIKPVFHFSYIYDCVIDMQVPGLKLLSRNYIDVHFSTTNRKITTKASSRYLYSITKVLSPIVRHNFYS